MRNRFSDVFYGLARHDERLVMIVADISPAGSMEKFRKEFPNRFINVGVAEQSMIGIAAGMALRGFRPFCYTIASFALFRPFEFIRDDLCYQNLPVTVVGMGAGLSYSTLGATHHATEDVAIACALPNMTVLAPCDTQETEAATRWCAQDAKGPVYLRLGKTGERDFSPSWHYGQPARLRNGGEDVCVLTYGPIVDRAMAVAEILDATVFSVSTLKPLDLDWFQDLEYERIVVIEETSPAVLAPVVHQVVRAANIWSCCLEDQFIHQYGSRDKLLDLHGLNIQQICAQIGKS